jgi:DNA-binding transcriptional regulator YdaS (Cro superfamily)
MFKTDFDLVMTTADCSNKALSDSVGCTEQDVSDWRSGVTPIPSAYVQAVSDHLGADISQHTAIDLNQRKSLVTHCLERYFGKKVEITFPKDS